MDHVTGEDDFLKDMGKEHPCEWWPNACSNWVDDRYEYSQELAGKGDTDVAYALPPPQHFAQMPIGDDSINKSLKYHF